MKMWQKKAKRDGTTRAVASMEKACELDEKLIFAIGNAPTALIHLYELIRAGKNPARAGNRSAGWIC